MPKDYRVTRDQAVWERETFYLSVPDDVPQERHDDWIYEQLDKHCSGEVDLGPFIQIEDSVEGMDTILEIHPQDVSQ